MSQDSQSKSGAQKCLEYLCTQVKRLDYNLVCHLDDILNLLFIQVFPTIHAHIRMGHLWRKMNCAPRSVDYNQILAHMRI